METDLICLCITNHLKKRNEFEMRSSSVVAKQSHHFLVYLSQRGKGNLKGMKMSHPIIYLLKHCREAFVCIIHSVSHCFYKYAK